MALELLQVGRDGDFSNQVAAVVLAPVKDFDNYAWFFKCVISRGYPLKSSPTFRGRNCGLISAATSLGVFNMQCVGSFIGTCVIFLFPLKAETYDMHGICRVDFFT